MENQSKSNISKEANRNSKLKQELLEAQENASTKSLFVSVCIWSWDGVSFLNQLENLAPHPKPVRYETKTKRDLVTRVFPRFEHFAHIHTKFSLVSCNVFLWFFALIGYTLTQAKCWWRARGWGPCPSAWPIAGPGITYFVHVPPAWLPYLLQLQSAQTQIPLNKVTSTKL